MKRTVKSNKIRILSLVLILMVVMTSISFGETIENSGMAFDKKVVTRVDSERALEHIEYLSEVIGPRVAGTEEEREAAEYIKSQFEKIGYEPKMQEFNYDSTEVEVVVNGEQLSALGGTVSGYTDSEGITEELVPCGLGIEAGDFPEAVSGKIALIQRGEVSFASKATNAIEAGAIGVILYNNVEGMVRPWISDEAIAIPFVSISKADGEEILSKITEGEIIEANIRVEKVIKQSQNVIAVREPYKENNGIIYVTAHYDSVPGAPGANDNASGTAMMLEFARILKAYPIDKEVRYIACGAEEIGLLGSEYYVNQLTDEEIENSIANFNMDMIATSDEECSILEVSTVDGEENYVSQLAVEAGARLGSLTQLEAEYGVSSDHRYFGYEGIPHGGFIWRTPGGSLEPWYHTPQDTIEQNISLDKYQEAGEIIGAALYEALRRPTPNLNRSAVRNVQPILLGEQE